MPGARRAPPPPPSGGAEFPPPLPSRGNNRSNAIAEPVPPPLPSRPGVVGEPADDFYEDMNGGGFPKIIDARPNKRNTSQAILPPSHASLATSMSGAVNRCPSPSHLTPTKPKVTVWAWDSFRELGNKFTGGASKYPGAEEKQRRSTVGEMGRSSGLQQESLEMEETYELPVVNAQVESQGFFPNPHQRVEKSDDADSSEEWSDFDDEVEDEGNTADETYEVPEDQPLVQEDVYEQADEVDTPSRFQSPPKQIKKFGVDLHPATLQMSKMKLNAVQSHNASEASPKSTAPIPSKPKPPPKPRGSGTGSQAMGASSIVKALADSLNARAKGMKPTFENHETNENVREDSASAGSSSSQSGGQYWSNDKEARASAPFSPPFGSKPEKPPVQKSTPVTPKQPKPQMSVVEDDIYDDAVTDSLLLYDWYHEQVDRKEAEARVKSVKENGAFLIRESTGNKSKPGHRYTLVVMNNSKAHNLIIRQRSDDKFALGQTEKADEVTFSAIKELVEHHRANNVRLVKEGELVKLTSSPRRP